MAGRIWSTGLGFDTCGLHQLYKALKLLQMDIQSAEIGAPYKQLLFIVLFGKTSRKASIYK